MMGAVLMATQGQYSDRDTWAVAAFVDAQYAEAHKVAIEEEWARVVDEVKALDESMYGVEVHDDGSVVVDYGRTTDIKTSLASLGMKSARFYLGEECPHLFIVEMEIRGFAP